MGIIVSWINSAWAIAEPQLTASQHNSNDNAIPDHDPLSDRHNHLDSGSGDARSSSPTTGHADQHSLPALRQQTSSLATSIPSLESPTPPPAPPGVGASTAFIVPNIGPIDNSQLLFVSSDYNERPPVVPPMVEPPPSPGGASPSGPRAPGSPPPSNSHGLRIDVAAANDPTMDHEMTDASFIAAAGQQDNCDDMCFDDEGLSALEKIYLFARSNASFHRYVRISPPMLEMLRHILICSAAQSFHFSLSRFLSAGCPSLRSRRICYSSHELSRNGRRSVKIFRNYAIRM